MNLDEVIELFLESHTPKENQPLQTLHDFRTWYWSTILNYNLPREEESIELNVSYTEREVNSTEENNKENKE